MNHQLKMLEPLLYGYNRYSGEGKISPIFLHKESTVLFIVFMTFIE
jgi:hypothetical protein